MDQNQPNIEGRYRTLFILWFAISMSVLIFFVIVFVTPVKAPGDPKLSLIINCAGVAPLGLSFLLKSQILHKAILDRRLAQIQTAYVLAFALSEMAALLAVLDHFINAGRYFYVGFILAGLGMLLHFPTKKHFLEASGQEF